MAKESSSERSRTSRRTIGHVDHGKTHPDRGADQGLGDNGWSKFISYDEVAKASASQGRRDATKILTIATSHVEYESKKRHYAHVDSRTPDYVKNMITGRRDGRRHPGVSAVDGPCRRPRARASRLPGERAAHRGFLNKVDLVDDAELLDLVEMEIRDLLKQYKFPGDETPESSAGLRSRLFQATRETRAQAPIPQADGRDGQLHPEPVPRPTSPS